MKIPYHVLKIQDREGLHQEILLKQDEFLDVYSFYLATQVQWVRDEVKLKAYELRLLDPSFRFAI